MTISVEVDPHAMFADILAGSKIDARSQVRSLIRMRSMLTNEGTTSSGQIWVIRRLWLIVPEVLIKFGENQGLCFTGAEPGSALRWLASLQRNIVVSENFAGCFSFFSSRGNFSEGKT